MGAGPPCYSGPVKKFDHAHPIRGHGCFRCDHEMADMYREAIKGFADYHWGKGHHVIHENTCLTKLELDTSFHIAGYRCRSEKDPAECQQTASQAVPTGDMLKLWKKFDAYFQQEAKSLGESIYNIPAEAERPWAGVPEGGRWSRFRHGFPLRLVRR
ncbi:hypothetical protein DL546_000984 [Coniochaeta pulveracea]|uniref:Uncharacterized protein n=1 Tax=Coniochaeta pulveracea TaxID=177199 RepID=A0A420Y2D1_9PEZI|nr:hypothetical protein DL546_000984 [Coniochaeta pulveracea]